VLIFLGRRLLQAIPIVLFLTLLIFYLLNTLPGDPTFSILGESATPEQRAELREAMGLDDPVVLQYVRWLGGIVQGDFGESFRTGQSVVAVLLSRLPVTLELTILSLAIGVAVGLPLGMVAARNRNGPIDLVISSAAVSLLALPYFVIATGLILIFAVHLRVLPPSGYVPFFEDPVGNLRFMTLPAVALGSSVAAIVARQTRAAFLNVAGEEFVRVAAAKGLSERRILFRHSLKFAAIPIVTVVGLQAGNLIAGSVIMETVFSIPGLGRLLVNSILDRDFAIVQGAVIFIVLAVVVINMLTDLSYAVLDPRTKVASRAGAGS
jgi:peptide/nickel transport system permease protein